MLDASDEPMTCDKDELDYRHTGISLNLVNARSISIAAYAVHMMHMPVTKNARAPQHPMYRLAYHDLCAMNE